ncbi:hypothetical protein [Paenibacillus pabuli]
MKRISVVAAAESSNGGVRSVEANGKNQEPSTLHMDKGLHEP